jgi:hypothetical protein
MSVHPILCAAVAKALGCTVRCGHPGSLACLAACLAAGPRAGPAWRATPPASRRTRQPPHPASALRLPAPRQPAAAGRQSLGAARCPPLPPQDPTLPAAAITLVRKSFDARKQAGKRFVYVVDVEPQVGGLHTE